MKTEPTANAQMEQTPLGAAWRYRWLVLALTVLGAGLAFFFATETDTIEYEATASLVVTDPRASTLFSSAEVARDEERYVEDQVAILRSDSVAQRASELIATQNPEAQLDATEIVETVEIVNTGSNEIVVQYTAISADTAVDTVNAVILAYEQVREEQAARESASAIDQLEQSIANIDAELDDIEVQILTITQLPQQTALDQQHAAAVARLIQLQPRLVTATEEELILLRLELADIDQILARRPRLAAELESVLRACGTFRGYGETASRGGAYSQA